MKITYKSFDTKVKQVKFRARIKFLVNKNYFKSRFGRLRHLSMSLLVTEQIFAVKFSSKAKYGVKIVNLRIYYPILT